MASSRKYADLADINYFDWANSMTQADPFGGVDIDSFVASLMKSGPALKSEKFVSSAPTFAPRLQEPECILPAPAAPACGAQDSSSNDADEEFNALLSCGTCFVPVLDLSPDEHGVTVNTFGSTGVVQPAPVAEDATPMIQPVFVKPVVEDSVPISAAFQFRELVDCPTCFVPSSDLSPDEHGTMVNTGATRTTAVALGAIPEPEFLSYEPFDDDFLLGTPVAQQQEEQFQWDACTDNTAGGDPFASLWGNTGSDGGFPNAPPAEQVVSGLGKRMGVPLHHSLLTSDATTSDAALAAVAAMDAWSSAAHENDGAVEQPVKRKKVAALASSAECEDDLNLGEFAANEAAEGVQAPTRNLCPRATRILKEWMTSAEHFDHPYPDEKEKLELAAKAGITTKQLTIWFTNARKRLWVPMRKRQGLPIIGFTEYRTEQKRRLAEEQSRAGGAAPAATEPSAGKMKPCVSSVAAPVLGATLAPAAAAPTKMMQPVQPVLLRTPMGAAKLKLQLPVPERKPAQQFVIGKMTFDTALEPASVVLAKMEVLSKSLAADKRELATRMLNIEQQERTLRAAMQALRT